jgi:endoglucanase
MSKDKYKKNKWESLVQLVMTLFLLSLVLGVQVFAQETPLSQNGRLQVIGNHLCNDDGYPIQLRGMSSHGLNYFPWGDCVNKRSLDALAYEWGSDIFRVAMYTDPSSGGGYKSNSAYYRAMIDTIVKEASERGIYVILDWHILSLGDPWDNINYAREFFDYMSQKHGHKEHVLYELCNEPNGGVSWSRIKAYAKDLIPRIRANDPDGIIIVGTPGWSSFGMSGDGSPEEIINNPLTGDNAHNVMYSFHFYAASHGQTYRDGVRSAADHIPIFVTEWGTQEATGDGQNDIESSQLWIDLMADKKISWTNWNFCDDWRSGAAFNPGTCPNGPWTGSSLKESGRLVINWIQNPPDDFR